MLVSFMHVCYIAYLTFLFFNRELEGEENTEEVTREEDREESDNNNSSESECDFESE